MISYKVGNELPIDQVIDVYRASTLGLRRPVDDQERMQKMLSAANLVITAWDQDSLVGIARSLTDFVFCTYLSDLAVDIRYQRQGIGKELMRRTQEAGGKASIFLFAAPAAEDYYQHVGFSAGCGFLLREGETIK
jgi:predicted N-acetyltransferase YhbS